MQKYPVVKLANANAPEIDGFPGAAELAALRAWYSGMSTRDAVDHYLGDQRLEGQSSRSMIGQIRRRLATLARQRKREDLAAAFEHAESDRIRCRRAAGVAIELLRSLAMPVPQISDDDLCSDCRHCDYRPGDMSGWVEMDRPNQAMVTK